MKTSSKIMLVIGILLLVLQIQVYSGNPIKIPSYNYDIFGMVGFVAWFVGFNLIGVVGVILIVIGLKRKGGS